MPKKNRSARRRKNAMSMGDGEYDEGGVEIDAVCYFHFFGLDTLREHANRTIHSKIMFFLNF